MTQCIVWVSHRKRFAHCIPESTWSSVQNPHNGASVWSHGRLVRCQASHLWTPLNGRPFLLPLPDFNTVMANPIGSFVFLRSVFCFPNSPLICALLSVFYLHCMEFSVSHYALKLCRFCRYYWKSMNLRQVECNVEIAAECSHICFLRLCTESLISC